MKEVKAIWVGAVLCSCLCFVSCATGLVDETATGSTEPLGSSTTANVILKSNLNAPTSIVADSLGNFFVADSQNNRILKLDSTGAVLLSYGSKGSGTGKFDQPRGLAIDSQGEIWVSDSNNDRIVRFNPASADSFTNSFWTFGVSGTGSTQFSQPVDIALQVSGEKTNVCVVDLENSRIQIVPIALSSNTVDTANIESWTFDDVTTYGKAISIEFQSDNFYVARKKGVVEKYTSLRVFAGKRYGQDTTVISEDPGDIYFANNKLYVADHGNDKIHVYKAAGARVKSYGSTGTSLGQFDSPKAVFAKDGQVYVIEEGNNRLQTFLED